MAVMAYICAFIGIASFVAAQSPSAVAASDSSDSSAAVPDPTGAGANLDLGDWLGGFIGNSTSGNVTKGRKRRSGGNSTNSTDSSSSWLNLGDSSGSCSACIDPDNFTLPDGIDIFPWARNDTESNDKTDTGSAAGGGSGTTAAGPGNGGSSNGNGTGAGTTNTNTKVTSKVAAASSAEARQATLFACAVVLAAVVVMAARQAGRLE